MNRSHDGIRGIEAICSVKLNSDPPTSPILLSVRTGLKSTIQVLQSYPRYLFYRYRSYNHGQAFKIMSCDDLSRNRERCEFTTESELTKAKLQPYFL